MKVFGVAGYSGMGKTTLLARLVPALIARGRRVSLIKHSHKDIEVDRPGKDSYRLREAGCHEVLLLGSSRWALMHELRGAEEPSLDDLLAPAGRRPGAGGRLQARRFPEARGVAREVGKPTLWPQWPGIRAIASDDGIPDT